MLPSIFAGKWLEPLKSAAWGKLKGQGISYPWKPDTPVTINDFAVTAATDKINLVSADLTFGSSRLQAAGNMTRSARNVLVDMDPPIPSIWIRCSPISA